MPIDRRAARTRGALYDALAALIVQKDYEKITIHEILENANVGRSTFYAHFTSKDDLLAGGLSRLRTMLADGAANDAEDASRWSYSATAFQHVSEYRQIYYSLAGTHAGDVVLEALRSVIEEHVSRHGSIQWRVPRELGARHVAGTFMTIVAWWLERNPDLPVEEVDRLFHRLLKGVDGAKRDECLAGGET